jgi:large-conductance mechanosensitive channel
MHENLDRMEEIKVPSDRSFGIVFTLVFLIVGIWMVLGGQSEGWFFLAGSVLFLILALARPSILAPLNRMWMKFGLLLSRLVNPLILGVVFFLVITPIAITRRLLNKDSLHLKSTPNLKSYWITRKPLGPKPGSMTRQF